MTGTTSKCSEWSAQHTVYYPEAAVAVSRRVRESLSVPLQGINGSRQGEDNTSWLGQTPADVLHPWIELMGECRDTLHTMTEHLNHCTITLGR